MTANRFDTTGYQFPPGFTAKVLEKENQDVVLTFGARAGGGGGVKRSVTAADARADELVRSVTGVDEGADAAEAPIFVAEGDVGGAVRGDSTVA